MVYVKRSSTDEVVPSLLLKQVSVSPGLLHCVFCGTLFIMTGNVYLAVEVSTFLTLYM